MTNPEGVESSYPQATARGKRKPAGSWNTSLESIVWSQKSEVRSQKSERPEVRKSGSPEVRKRIQILVMKYPQPRRGWITMTPGATRG